MTQFLRNLSIQRKLLVIIMLASGVALFLACAAFVIYDLRLIRQSMVEETMSLANMVARITPGALEFDNAEEAAENLKAFEQDPHIIGSAIFKGGTNAFAVYSRPGANFNPVYRRGPDSLLSNETLEVWQPIRVADEEVGTLYIQTDLEQLYQRIQKYFVIGSFVLLASGAVAFLISVQLQKVISIPILNLARTTQQVSDKKDYSIRARTDNQDEIGLLFEAFNDMLSQIQIRDAALQRARDELEKRVEERTIELQQEVAERKRAEEALRISEVRFRSLVQTASDGIMLADQEGKIIFCNSGAEKLFGYSAQEVLGQPLTLLMPGFQKEMSTGRDNRSLQSTSEPVELMGRNRDGSEFPLEASLTSWETGGNTFYTGILRDVTERKRALEQLRAFARKLEISNRELQDFAYVASHDLQEPLRKVQAFGDRLHGRYGDALGAEGADYLKRMQSAAHRMQNLISDLLAFSRVTTKANPFARVDLNKVLKEVLSDLEVRIQQTQGKIISTPLPSIEADPLQMRQLLQNLLSNALKFQQEGVTPEIHLSSKEIEVEVSQPSGPQLATFVQLEVKDNGIGFDEKYLDRIFTVFQRLHGRGTYEGTGIGLAICRKIVDRHGGSITARSAPGEGATFIIKLPLKQPKES